MSRPVSRALSALDCMRCGACCCNPDENRAEGFIDYIEVDRGAPLWKKPEAVRRLVVFNADGVPHLKLDGTGKCAALKGAVGRKVSCSIYELRPLGCRKVEAGSTRCLQYRRERGVDLNREATGSRPRGNRRERGRAR